MNDSILNISVSCFKNCRSTIPKDVNLLSWLTSDRYKDKVEELRSVQDKKLKTIIKKSLPAITPSGLFRFRSAQDLIEHYGFLSFDIDFKDNKHIKNFNELKQQISHITSVAYCGLSISGKGFWGLVPIPKSTSKVHKQRFLALVEDFHELGINLHWIVSGCGSCPIAPVLNDEMKAMGVTNDCILFTGNVTVSVDIPEGRESEFVALLKKAPSSASPSYGKPFYETLQDVGGDFYKIDAGLFAPAQITVINRTTGNIFTEGTLYPEKLNFS